VVPGIDFSNDPLLQGRLFSYTDTQLLRLGGPNFNEIPINRPLCPFHNNNRDAPHRQTINKGRAAYEPNSIDGGWPRETPEAPSGGGFASYPEPMSGIKLRKRADSFSDHFSQARLFWNSMAPHEQEHMIAAYSFELGKVERREIREREVYQILTNIDPVLATRVAQNLGLPTPVGSSVAPPQASLKQSPALSQANLLSGNIRSRKVAILLADGADVTDISHIIGVLNKEGATAKVIGPSSAAVKTSDGNTLMPDATFDGLPSVAFDAVFVPGGAGVATALQANGAALHYLLEAYKHLKAIALCGEASDLLAVLRLEADEGLLSAAKAEDLCADLVKAMAQHRVWAREPKAQAVPA
jgi:catalase